MVTTIPVSTWREFNQPLLFTPSFFLSLSLFFFHSLVPHSTCVFLLSHSLHLSFSLSFFLFISGLYLYLSLSTYLLIILAFHFRSLFLSHPGPSLHLSLSLSCFSFTPSCPCVLVGASNMVSNLRCFSHEGCSRRKAGWQRLGLSPLSLWVLDPARYC